MCTNTLSKKVKLLKEKDNDSGYSIMEHFSNTTYSLDSLSEKHSSFIELL
jgi:hypothetical protein